MLQYIHASDGGRRSVSRRKYYEVKLAVRQEQIMRALERKE